MTETKRCTKCRVVKPVPEFTTRRAKGHNYLRPHCRTCVRAQNQKRQAAVRQARKDAMALQGIDIHHCNICGVSAKTVAARGKGPSAALHSDHCHTSGNDRGVLCLNCNFGLGYFKDNPELLRAAVKYLKRASASS